MPDAYLFVSSRVGPLQGESQAVGHSGEIDVYSWHWGVAANSALATSRVSPKRNYKPLTVFKRIDVATTKLLASMKNGDEMSEVRLTVGETAGGVRDLFSISLSAVRLSEIDYERQADGFVYEKLTFSHHGAIEVKYVGNDLPASSGQRGATSLFDDSVA